MSIFSANIHCNVLQWNRKGPQYKHLPPHDQHYLCARRPEGDMQHCTVLCDVDVLASKHSINLFPQFSPICQVCQKLQQCMQIFNALMNYIPNNFLSTIDESNSIHTSRVFFVTLCLEKSAMILLNSWNRRSLLSPSRSKSFKCLQEIL